MAALGTSQHLKSVYGGGYVVEAVASREHVDGLKELMQSFTDNAKLEESYGGYVRYLMNGIKLSEVFARMEANKERLALETYSVSQTSLEQVFLRFVQMQEAADAAALAAKSATS